VEDAADVAEPALVAAQPVVVVAQEPMEPLAAVAAPVDLRPMLMLVPRLPLLHPSRPPMAARPSQLFLTSPPESPVEPRCCPRPPSF
jgi:hypothetical protein